jgi:hypothetical protein
MSFMGKRYDQAHAVWRQGGDYSAFLRLRAEVLLERLASLDEAAGERVTEVRLQQMDGSLETLPLTEADREELERIASAPKGGREGDDNTFLGQFDGVVDADGRGPNDE